MRPLAKSRTLRLLGLTCLTAVALAGCPKATADLELQAAREAIDQARAQKANDCAGETYQAAETAIAEAARLADAGEIDAAKEKANQAASLAAQARSASPPGCDEETPAEDETAAPDLNPSATDEASIEVQLEDALQTVYFDYNQATIREDSKAVLSRVAEAMSRMPRAAVEIEGHCDVRGSTEYNLHLGERRAYAVRKYLLAQGVNENQLRIISYGEERPVDLGLSEAAHQKNRRAELKRL